MSVDVAGIKNNERIFIECGTLTPKNKIEMLKPYCNKVIHLRYPKEIKEGKAFNFEMPEQLHKDFKIKCIDLSVDMQDKIVELVKEFVEKNKSKVNTMDCKKQGCKGKAIEGFFSEEGFIYKILKCSLSCGWWL